MGLSAGVLILSVLLQFAAATLALRLMRTTGWQLAWGLIAGGLFLMGLRRLVSLGGMLAAGEVPAFQLPELIALVISGGMLAGVALIGPQFRERRRMEGALRDGEQRLRLLLDASRDGIFGVDAEGVIDFVNPACLRFLGYQDADQLLGRGAHLLLHAPPERGGDDATHCPLCRAHAGGGVPRLDEAWLWRADGSRLPVEYRASPLPGGGAVVSFSNEEERRRTEEGLLLLSRVVNQSSDIVFLTDAGGTIKYVNPAFERVTGYRRAEVVGRSASVLRSGQHDDQFYRRLWRTIIAGGVYRDVIVNRRKDGSLYHEEKTISPIKDETGAITHFVSTGKDVTEERRARAELDHLAYHDPLTQLPNRLLFRDRLEQAVVRAKRQETLVAVMFLDLDNFKQINDSLGHAVGDKLLKTIARRLVRSVRNTDTVARLGGDEFTIIMEGVHHVSQVTRMARKLLEAVAHPLEVDRQQLGVTASLGIVLCPLDSQVVDVLIKNADTAMYHAKEMGKNTFSYYSADMTRKVVSRLALERELQRALVDRRFELNYQPIVRLAGRRTAGVEALLRWRRPGHGWMPPARFVPVLEDIGLIGPVTEWVLHSAGEALADPCGRGGCYLSFNLSWRLLHGFDVRGMVERFLDHGLLAPGQLLVEVTESTLVQDLHGADALLRHLKDLGLRIALDDFGTGQSSLNHLRQFPIDVVKIDRGFVRDLTAAGNAAALVQAVVGLAHSLGMEVIAEGVETAAQLRHLEALGCDAVQGYLFSRPEPLARLDLGRDWSTPALGPVAGDAEGAGPRAGRQS